MPTIFEQFVDAIHEALGDPGVAKLVYRRSLPNFDAPRRIVWIPKGGRIGPASTPGVRVEHHKISTTERITALASKLLTVQAYVFAESDETLECLHDNVLLAVYVALSKSAEPGAFEVVTEREDVAGIALNGQAALVQEFTFDLPVVKQLVKLTTVTSQDHECELQTNP